MNRRAFLAGLLLLIASHAWADFVGYAGKHEISAGRGALKARHYHDWSANGALFADLVHHERFFTPANNFSFVELRDHGRLVFRSPAPALTYLWISPDGKYLIGLSNVMLRNPYQLVVWKRDGSLLHREHISAEVAKLSPEQRHTFANRFRKAERFLSNRYFAYRGSTYLDYTLLGVPDEIGRRAWSYLYSLRVPHPYSNDFSETVTNFVHWFDEKDPGPRLLRDGSEISLSLRSPRGKRFSIPLSKP